MFGKVKLYYIIDYLLPMYSTQGDHYDVFWGVHNLRLRCFLGQETCHVYKNEICILGVSEFNLCFGP